ncbi:MAG: hypothetical protein NTZ74_11105 [Chloroflexi bacterium]|nr:hypothetical protein [Chloroflexota bacterium]
MPPRKRFNAFDDLSSKETIQPKIKPASLSDPVSSTPLVERIERLVPSQMIPDRFQPRRLLPVSLRSDFFGNRINCYQAALEWLALARADQGCAAEVEKLLSMGSSFEEHGQIKSITGKWNSSPTGEYVFQIETGERRFWAACLQYASSGAADEPQLRVEVVDHPTRQRQVLENRHAEPPSAVEQACEIASLVLAEQGIEPEMAVEDDFDFFRQARNSRMPSGLWDKLIPLMQLTRPRMVQLLNILQFSTSQLELADRYRLSERVLREILSAPREQWDRMIRMSIQNQLTSDEISDLLTPPSANEPPNHRPSTPILPEPGRQAARSLRRFVQTLSELDRLGRDEALDEIADTLVVKGNAKESLILLEELTRLIRARLDRK